MCVCVCVWMDAFGDGWVLNIDSGGPITWCLQEPGGEATHNEVAAGLGRLPTAGRRRDGRRPLSPPMKYRGQSIETDFN